MLSHCFTSSCISFPLFLSFWSHTSNSHLLTYFPVSLFICQVGDTASPYGPVTLNIIKTYANNTCSESKCSSLLRPLQILHSPSVSKNERGSKGNKPPPKVSTQCSVVVLPFARLSSQHTLSGKYRQFPVVVVHYMCRVTTQIQIFLSLFNFRQVAMCKSHNLSSAHSNNHFLCQRLPFQSLFTYSTIWSSTENMSCL